jgi:hypothetical protein
LVEWPSGFETSGNFAFHNDATATNVLSVISAGPGWHLVELHLAVAGPGSIEMPLTNSVKYPANDGGRAGADH